jgi:hypothetical protein
MQTKGRIITFIVFDSKHVFSWTENYKIHNLFINIILFSGRPKMTSCSQGKGFNNFVMRVLRRHLQ